MIAAGSHHTKDDRGRYAGTLLVLGCRVGAVVMGGTVAIVYVAWWQGQRAKFELPEAELRPLVGT